MCSQRAKAQGILTYFQGFSRSESGKDCFKTGRSSVPYTYTTEILYRIEIRIATKIIFWHSQIFAAKILTICSFAVIILRLNIGSGHAGVVQW